MNATRNPSRGFGLLAMVAVLLAPLALAPEASAGHDLKVDLGGFTIGWGPGAVVHGPAPAPMRRAARPPRIVRSIEFRRGADLALEDGRKNGYWDGYSGQPRCDTPTRDLACFSRPFVRGYLASYAAAYGGGFEAGLEARCHAPAVRHPVKVRRGGFGHGPWRRRSPGHWR